MTGLDRQAILINELIVEQGVRGPYRNSWDYTHTVLILSVASSKLFGPMEYSHHPTIRRKSAKCSYIYSCV